MPARSIGQSGGLWRWQMQPSRFHNGSRGVTDASWGDFSSLRMCNGNKYSWLLPNPHFSSLTQGIRAMMVGRAKRTHTFSQESQQEVIPLLGCECRDQYHHQRIERRGHGKGLTSTRFPFKPPVCQWKNYVGIWKWVGIIAKLIKWWCHSHMQINIPGIRQAATAIANAGFPIPISKVSLYTAGWSVHLHSLISWLCQLTCFLHNIMWRNSDQVCPEGSTDIYKVAVHFGL